MELLKKYRVLLIVLCLAAVLALATTVILLRHEGRLLPLFDPRPTPAETVPTEESSETETEAQETTAAPDEVG